MGRGAPEPSMHAERAVGCKRSARLGWLADVLGHKRAVERACLGGALGRQRHVDELQHLCAAALAELDGLQGCGQGGGWWGKQGHELAEEGEGRPPSRTSWTGGGRQAAAAAGPARAAAARASDPDRAAALRTAAGRPRSHCALPALPLPPSLATAPWGGHTRRLGTTRRWRNGQELARCPNVPPSPPRLAARWHHHRLTSSEPAFGNSRLQRLGRSCITGYISSQLPYIS